VTDETVVREVVLRAERDAVWSALTEGGRMSEWFGGTVAIDPRVRGRVSVAEPSGDVREGVVVGLLHPIRLVIEWAAAPDHAKPASRVEFTLEEVDGGTRLTVVERSISASRPVGFLAEVSR